MNVARMQRCGQGLQEFLLANVYASKQNGTTMGHPTSTAKRRVTYRSELGPKFSEGARQIWLRAASRRLSDPELAAKSGIDRSSIFKYKWGDVRPGRVHADRLFRALGIKPSMFDEAPVEKNFVPHAA